MKIDQYPAKIKESKNQVKLTLLTGREAMVQWLRQMAHDQEVVGSNPGTVYWMDVSDLLAITLKKN